MENEESHSQNHKGLLYTIVDQMRDGGGGGGGGGGEGDLTLRNCTDAFHKRRRKCDQSVYAIPRTPVRQIYLGYRSTNEIRLLLSHIC